MRRRIKENLKTNVKTNDSIGKEWAIKNGYISPDEFRKQKVNWEKQVNNNNNKRFNDLNKKYNSLNKEHKQLSLKYENMKDPSFHRKWAEENGYMSPEQLDEQEKIMKKYDKQKDFNARKAFISGDNAGYILVRDLNTQERELYTLPSTFDGSIKMLNSMIADFSDNKKQTASGHAVQLSKDTTQYATMEAMSFGLANISQDVVIKQQSMSATQTQRHLNGASIQIELTLIEHTDVWLYQTTDLKGKCEHIHNGTENYKKVKLPSLPQSLIVRHGSQIKDGVEFRQDWDMGKLRDYIGQVVSFVSLGNSNFAIDDTGNQQAGKGYHLWTFTNDNVNQQFKVLSSGQLKRVHHNNQFLCISADVKNKKIFQKASKLLQLENEFNNNKDLIWKLNEQNQLVSAINEKMGIDISGSKYQNQTPILYWELHGGNNQKWKIVNIESFDSLFVGDANSLLTLIKLIGFILVFFCFICLLRAMRNDALHAQRTVSTDD